MFRKLENILKRKTFQTIFNFIKFKKKSILRQILKNFIQMENLKYHTNNFLEIFVTISLFYLKTIF